MRTNYILVDFENVQPEHLNSKSDTPIKVLVFVGDQQTKVPFELASSLQSLGERAQYVKIEGNGKNALDFHMAYHIGKLAKEDPNAYFHIVSKDKGFDPLVKYLKKNKVFSQRVNSVTEVTVLQSSYKTMEQRVEAIVDFLRSRGSARPRRVKTLENATRSFFANVYNESEVSGIVSRLVKLQYVKVEGQVVSYSLPPKL